MNGDMNDRQNNVVFKRYEEAIKNSKDFTDFEPLADFMLYALAFKTKSAPYVDKLESELLDRKILQTRINKREDFISSHSFCNPELNRVLYYISLIRDPLIIK